MNGVAGKKKCWGRWALRFGAVVLIGLGLLPWLFVSGPLSKRHLQPQWPTVQGNVVSSRLRCEPCSEDRWNLEVEFVYEVEDSLYSGEQEWFVGTGTPELPVGSRPPSAALTEKLSHPPGAVVPVFYNPADHSEAVIKPGRGSASSIEFVGLGFILSVIGVVSLLFGDRLLAQEATDAPPN